MLRPLLFLSVCLISMQCTRESPAPESPPAPASAPVAEASERELGVRSFRMIHETLPSERREAVDRAIEDQAALLWMDPAGLLPWRPAGSGWDVRLVHVRADSGGEGSGAEGSSRFSVGIAVVLTRHVPGDVDRTHRATAVREVGEVAELLEATGEALMEAYKGAEAHLQASSASDARILAWLSAARKPHLLPALEQVRERRLAGAVDALRPLLVLEGAHVREALGVAMALGDPALLSPVARLTGSQSTDVVRGAIHAIAAIGTPRAHQYLESIATGHAWEEGRVLARDLVP